MAITLVGVTEQTTPRMLVTDAVTTNANGISFTVRLDDETYHEMWGNLRRNVAQMRESLARTGEAMQKMAVSFSPLICCCGRYSDKHWEHTAEECTWKESS